MKLLLGARERLLLLPGRAERPTSRLTHRRGLREDVLAAQVRAGKRGHHGDDEVEDGDDHGFNGANWREWKRGSLLGKAGGTGRGASRKTAE